MGEDLKRKRTDRFMRPREACFAEQTRPDLFATLTPEMIVSLCGTAVGPVTLAQELWAQPANDGGPIDFYSGPTLAVRLEGAAADHLRGQQASTSSPVVAQVTDVEEEHGLVTLRIRGGVQ
jgi:hypothetical protein